MVYEVKIGKFKTIGFKFSIETWILLSDYTQLPPSDFGRMEEVSFFVKACYCASKLWFLEHGRKFRYSEDRIKSIIENKLSVQQGRDLANTILESRLGGDSIIKLAEEFFNKAEEVKKNLTTKKNGGK